MRTVHRYTLTVTEEQKLSMPLGAVLLDVGSHPGVLGWRVEGGPVPAMDLWALVDPTQPYTKRLIHVVATGGSVPEYSTRGYVGTVAMGDRGRRAVWHVFDGGEQAVS